MKAVRVEPFKYRLCGIVSLCLMVFMTFSFTGCYNAWVMHRAGVMTGENNSDGDLVRTVWLLPFMDVRSANTSEYSKAYRRDFLAACADSCKRLKLRTAPEASSLVIPRFPDGVNRGEIDNLQLAQAGREKGVSAAVTGRVTIIRADEESLGFGWFEEWVKFLYVHVELTLYDTETGAKLLEEYYSREIEISPEQFQDVRQGNMEAVRNEVETLINELALSAAEDFCKAMSEQPFKTFVADMADGKIRLTSGSDVGLVKGKRLCVYDSSRIIDSKTGHRFYIHGLKTGTVRIVSAEATTAIAEIIDGSVPDAAVCLKPYRE